MISISKIRKQIILDLSLMPAQYVTLTDQMIIDILKCVYSFVVKTNSGLEKKENYYPIVNFASKILKNKMAEVIAVINAMMNLARNGLVSNFDVYVTRDQAKKELAEIDSTFYDKIKSLIPGKEFIEDTTNKILIAGVLLGLGYFFIKQKF